MIEHLTVDDLLNQRSSEKFSVQPDKRSGKLRVIRNESKLKPCGCDKSHVCQLCAEVEKEEIDIEREIYKYAEKLPHCLVYKTDTKGNRKKGKWIKSNPLERKGKSDLVICYYGFYVGVEVKRPGEKQEPDQKEFELDVVSAMGEYWLVDSFDDFLELIKDFKIKAESFLKWKAVNHTMF